MACSLQGFKRKVSDWTVDPLIRDMNSLVLYGTRVGGDENIKAK